MWNIIIPAAGVGRRLKHYTQDVPKSLVQLNGKSILEHQLDAIPFECVRQLVFITGYKEDRLKEFISRQTFPFPVTFYYNDKYENSHCGYSLLKAREKMEEGFILINSDLIFSQAHFQLLINSNHANIICAKKVNDAPTDLQKVRTDKRSKVIEWKLKLDSFQGEVMGPLKMSSRDVHKVLSYCDGLSESQLLKIPCFTLFSHLVDQIDFYVEYVTDRKWCEIDTVEDLEQNQKIREQR